MDNQQEREQFEGIYNEYVERIFRFIFLKVSSRQVAEDLAADVFMKSWKEYRKGNVRSIRSFLYRLARNAVADYYRRQGGKDMVPIEEVERVSEDKSPQQEAETALAMSQVQEALKRIPDQYQDLVIWRYLEELSSEEIADILGKSEESVRVGVHRALQALKKELERGV